MADNRIIKVCPDCDSSRLRKITGRWNGEKGHYCEDCQDQVNPVEREAVTPGSGSTLVDRLSEMNPDEIGR